MVLHVSWPPAFTACFARSATRNVIKVVVLCGIKSDKSGMAGGSCNGRCNCSLYMFILICFVSLNSKKICTNSEVIYWSPQFLSSLVKYFAAHYVSCFNINGFDTHAWKKYRIYFGFLLSRISPLHTVSTNSLPTVSSWTYLVKQNTLLTTMLKPFNIAKANQKSNNQIRVKGSRGEDTWRAV